MPRWAAAKRRGVNWLYLARRPRHLVVVGDKAFHELCEKWRQVAARPLGVHQHMSPTVPHQVHVDLRESEIDTIPTSEEVFDFVHEAVQGNNPNFQVCVEM